MVIRMNKPTGAKRMSECLPLLIETMADIVEHNVIGRKTFTTEYQYHNLLRREDKAL
jgi:hypothetical protein